MKFVEHKGKFVKHCPCTPDAVPCGYYNLNLHTGCPYACSYCILQAYLPHKEPVFYTNLDQVKRELDRACRDHEHLRIGTGELSDSLALDASSGYSHKILDIFADYPQVIFEFKTKSTQVRELLAYPKVLDNIVVSWSLNPQAIIAREELLTPDLADRLQALAQTAARGYKIGIHFDPLVYCRDWQAQYTTLIREIARVVEVDRIAWWSLGALRFPHSLREHIFKFKDSRLFEGELIRGYDDKYRYFKPLRMELFRFTIRQIRAHVSDRVPLYLCMEDAEVWGELLPHIPADEKEINAYLYRCARRGDPR